MGKKTLHDARKTAKMKETERSMDSQYSYKNFVFLSWVLNKGTHFFKKGDCIDIYILEYKEYLKKYNKKKLNPDSVQRPGPWDILLNQDGLD